MSSLTSGSDVTENLLALSCVMVCMDESPAGGKNDCVSLGFGDIGEFPLGKGEVEGVAAGEGCGERVPISMARSSVQARPRLPRCSSVSLSTTSSRVR